MRRRTVLALAAAGVTALGGCTAQQSPSTRSPTPSAFPAAGTPPAVDAPTDPFVTGNANFGFALQARLADEAPGENRFLSPYSVGVALAMAYAGARGNTRTEMADAIRFRPRGEDLHRSVAALRSDLPLADTSGTPTPSPTPPEETPVGETVGHPFRLLGANAAWGQADWSFHDAYLDVLSESYGVGLGTVDFRSDPGTARQRINQWVEDRTRGEIPDLFPAGAIDRDTRFVLANAVYFRANWAKTFSEENTEPATFTALDGSTATVPMMEVTRTFPHAAVDGHGVLRLPYEGDHTEMVVLAPAEGRFREFERDLTAGRLAELIEATEAEKGTVRVPRFVTRSKLQLPSSLRAMGMETAFAADANFTGMTDESRVKLDDVLHEATVTVDERGTEAAAATGVEVVPVSGPSYEFVVDRPFLFAVRHRPTGAVLFLGRLVDAGAAQPD